jgi:hypothetical protein
MKDFLKKYSSVIGVFNIALVVFVLLVNEAQAEQQSAITSVNVDGLQQQNDSTITSNGSYNQYNLGGGGNNFGSSGFPTYDRIGDVQCAVSTFSAKAYGIQRHLSQGALQLGVTVPLTFGRCRSAQDDQVALMQFNLHQKQIEQHKQDILFQSKMLQVCSGLHTMGYVITVDNPLYQACLAFQPSELRHSAAHAEEPLLMGFGKPSAHEEERIALERLNRENEYPVIEEFHIHPED